MNKLKYTACIVVSLMACYGATKIQFTSPIKEREVMQQEAVNKPVALPAFQLTKNIDAQEFWADRAGE